MKRKLRTPHPLEMASILINNPALLVNFLHCLDCSLHEEMGKRHAAGHVKIEKTLRQAIAKLEVARDIIIRNMVSEIYESDHSVKDLADAYVWDFIDLGLLCGRLADMLPKNLTSYFSEASCFMMYAGKVHARITSKRPG